ncbi:MAG: hypothetical protein O3A54_08500 [Actinobacteria bacterium]|nr:hypothetical protein [Actinomycetota bacterium]
MQHSVSPQPSEQEAIAIAAALEALWPKVQPATERETPDTSWRFSGRWWNDSTATRRSRPGF